MSDQGKEQRTIPNFAVFTDAELYGFTKSGHELAGAAQHILDCRQAIARTVRAEYLVVDLTEAATEEKLADVRKRAEIYVRDYMQQWGRR
jgi:hypothetical protein